MIIYGSIFLEWLGTRGLKDNTLLFLQGGYNEWGDGGTSTHSDAKVSDH